MKSLKTLLYFFTLTLFAVAFIACEEELVSPADEQVIIVESFKEYSNWDVPEVQGATVSNGSAENVFTVELPENIYYVAGPVNGGQIFLTDGTKITCECTENAPNQTGGCSPTRVFGSYGCAMEDGCNACKKTVETSKDSDHAEPINVYGVIDFNKGISLITDRVIQNRTVDDLFLSNRADLIGQTNEYILEISEVTAGLEEFQEMIFAEYPREWDLVLAGATGDSRLSKVKANLYGNEIVLIIPTEEFDAINLSSPLRTNGSGGNVTCDCTGTGDGCERKKGPGYVTCRAKQCTKCTMTDES